MRLDKFLKVSRLIKRRTVANDACDNARVTVNGRRALHRLWAAEPDGGGVGSGRRRKKR